MKKYLIFLMALVATFTAVAQDVIVKNDNSTILCRIMEVNNNEVVYLKWSDLNGPRYVMDRSLIANINYQDGRQDKFNQRTSNAYAPGNQQTGEAQYNDRALLAMDRAWNTNEDILKARKYKIIGWTVGSSCVAGATLLLIIRGITKQGSEDTPYFIGAGAMYAIGIGTTIGCLIKANQLQKKAQAISFSPVFQQEFNIGNGQSLCAGVDVICDHQYKQTTLGLGFQYNF